MRLKSIFFVIVIILDVALLFYIQSIKLDKFLLGEENATLKDVYADIIEINKINKINISTANNKLYLFVYFPYAACPACIKNMMENVQYLLNNGFNDIIISYENTIIVKNNDVINADVKNLFYSKPYIKTPFCLLISSDGCVLSGIAEIVGKPNYTQVYIKSIAKFIKCKLCKV